MARNRPGIEKATTVADGGDAGVFGTNFHGHGAAVYRAGNDNRLRAAFTNTRQNDLRASDRLEAFFLRHAGVAGAALARPFGMLLELFVGFAHRRNGAATYGGAVDIRLLLRHASIGGATVARQPRVRLGLFMGLTRGREHIATYGAAVGGPNGILRHREWLLVRKGGKAHAISRVLGERVEASDQTKD